MQSKRTIQGIVTGPGRVTIAAAADTARLRTPQPQTEVSRNHRERHVEHISVCPHTLAVALVVAALLGGCSALDRLKNIGEQPPLSAIENPTAQPGYKPVQMPMPAPQPAVYNPNSLWRNGSRAFFKDQRAMQVGDILTVKVKIHRQGQRSRTGPQRSRANKEDSGITDFFGSKLLTGDAAQVLPGKHPHRRLHLIDRQQGLGQPPGSLAHQRRRPW